MLRVVLHVDLDQFIVAVELRRRPELRGSPVLVGGSGDPTRRGVVAGASYEAREHGVRSGTPLRTAARRCPDAVFLPVDRPAYEQAAQEVALVLAELAAAHREIDALEPLGWDEAFLAADTDDPAGLARTVQARVLAATGLACSVGIGDNRLRAKTATAFGKPAGVFALTAATWQQVMGARPCGALWGVGSRTTQALAELGLTTVAELAVADPGRLAARFGPRAGPRLVELARGEDPGQVRAGPRRARSRGRETTFDEDVVDPEDVRAELLRLTGVLADDLTGEGREARRVVVQLRTSRFRDPEPRGRRRPALAGAAGAGGGRPRGAGPPRGPGGRPPGRRPGRAGRLTARRRAGQDGGHVPPPRRLARGGHR